MLGKWHRRLCKERPRSIGQESVLLGETDIKAQSGSTATVIFWSTFSKMSVTATESTVLTDQVPGGLFPVPRCTEAQCEAGRAWRGLSAMSGAPRRRPVYWNCPQSRLSRTTVQLLVQQGRVRTKKRVNRRPNNKLMCRSSYFKWPEGKWVFFFHGAQLRYGILILTQ